MRRRKQLLVADEVQHSLLMRVTLHWVLFLCANFLAIAIWIYWIELPIASAAERQAALIRMCVPMLACSLIVVPVFLYDIAKLSNQFAGPVLRIRNSLMSYLDKGIIDPVNLRKNDFWQALANDFNRLVSKSKTSSASGASKTQESYPEA